MAKSGMSSNGEPYRGVAALFNGDLNTVEPAYAPRKDWFIVSSERIDHVPVLSDQSLDGKDHWMGEVVDDERRSHEQTF